MAIQEEIRKYAVKNAVDYGKANPGTVLSKIISIHPELKQDIKSLSQEIATACNEVNSMKREDLETEYARHAAEFEMADVEKVKKTAKPKFELEGAVKGNFAVRASPEPSGYAHIGHAKQALLNYEFARIYEGKMYLYFDDTNPEKVKQEYVDAMRRDLAWLGIKFDGEYYASDNVEQMYDYARKMMQNGDAYVCQCDREIMKDLRFKGIPCEHKTRKPQENLGLFEQMVQGRFDEGQAVVRLNGDMKDSNTVLRDPVLLRVVKTPHYRVGTKYSVWPLYDFNTPILDSLKGITDIIRSKEYELRDALITRILGSLGLRVPRMHLEARLNIKGNVVQKRVIRQLIIDKLITSWDDPRLMTLMALRRRGILPEAIREFVLRFGMSKSESTVGIDMLFAENKRLIEPKSSHLFFVGNPVKLTVNETSRQQVYLKLHPSDEAGTRKYEVNSVFYISGDDAAPLKVGDAIRLKGLFDAKVISRDGSGITAEKMAGLEKPKVMQWVSEGNYSKCSVMIPGDVVDDEDHFNPDSLKVENGYVESYAIGLKERDTVQFERFGYCVLDSKANLQFIFMSK